MKKSLFVAFISALMLFVCGCGDNGYDTAEAAAEACINAGVSRDTNALWAMASEDSKKAMIDKYGSESKALDYLKKEAAEDSDKELDDLKSAMQNSESKKFLINILVKNCVVKVGDKYFINLEKYCGEGEDN